MPNDSLPTDLQPVAANAHSTPSFNNGVQTTDLKATNYKADRETVLKLLNSALTAELECVQRYRRHHFMARGIHPQLIVNEFLDHSNEEQTHADQLAERIMELGGAPSCTADELASRFHDQYESADTYPDGDMLVSMITEDLAAELIAIDSYRGIVRYLSGNDPATCRIVKGILAVEEQHANELADLLTEFPIERMQKKDFSLRSK